LQDRSLIQQKSIKISLAVAALAASLISLFSLVLAAREADPGAAPESVSASSPRPKVVVSNLPLHSLVAGIMGDQARPDLLFRRRVSHHDTALRPSQLRLLSNADLLVWAGPQLEQPIQTLIDKKVIKVRHWSAMDCKGQRLLLLPGQFALNETTEFVHGGSDVDQSYLASIDPHTWLDIDNAICFVGELSALLIEIDPAHSQQYQQNRDELIVRLSQFDQQLGEMLAAATQPFMVYHNSFRYLLSRYGLQAEGELNPAHGQPPGLRQLLAFRDQLKTTDASCLLADISASSRQLDEWLAGSSATLLMLDPMGSNLAPGEELYFQLLSGLGTKIARCLRAE